MTAVEAFTPDRCTRVHKRSLQSPATAGMRVDAYEGRGESMRARASGLL